MRMTVTAVERTPKGRARVTVHVDDGEPFEVARRVATEHGIRPGREITSDEIGRVVAVDQRRTALGVAAALLGRRARSEREVRDRLRMRRFEAAVIDETIAKLRARGFLDDARFARSWAESRDEHSPRGRRLVAQELRAHGVDAATAAAATEDISDVEAAYRVGSKRAGSLAGLARPAFRARLAGFLQRRGFGWDVVRETVDRCWREIAGSREDDLGEAID